MVRALRVAALCLPISLMSCALLPKPDKTPAVVPVVCPAAVVDMPCPSPTYILPADAISADLAAAVAIAEAKARDACAAQLAEAQACIRRHNGGTKRKQVRR